MICDACHDHFEIVPVVKRAFKATAINVVRLYSQSYTLRGVDDVKY